MAPLLTSVSVPWSPPLFRYHPLHAVVVHPSSVSVASPGPAVAQWGGRAFHGTVVTYSLGKEQTWPWQRERERNGEDPLNVELALPILGWDTPCTCRCAWCSRMCVENSRDWHNSHNSHCKNQDLSQSSIPISSDTHGSSFQPTKESLSDVPWCFPPTHRCCPVSLRTKSCGRD